MFGSIGGAEFVAVLVLALLLFGPRRLPEIGRTFGRALAELRNATRELRVGLERDVELERRESPAAAPPAVQPRTTESRPALPGAPAGDSASDDGTDPRRP